MSPQRRTRSPPQRKGRLKTAKQHSGYTESVFQTAFAAFAPRCRLQNNPPFPRPSENPKARHELHFRFPPFPPLRQHPCA
ncbi:hypothetical protein [Kingella potus]|uniref:hypothetical protein n=1 Tax=Kingella potus TaxID=265175 RepID=UPI001FCF9509|nr:hypothetical protein [Kingella potus]UOP01236.1 hypothetical protein LVJ84_02890 [Kingella potus]